MYHMWSLTRKPQDESHCVYCKCTKQEAAVQGVYCAAGTEFLAQRAADLAQAKIDIQEAVDTIPMRPSDKAKLLGKGWDLMMDEGDGGLRVKLLHKLSIAQLKGLQMDPHAGCVSVNSGRVHRELLRREVMAKQKEACDAAPMGSQ